MPKISFNIPFINRISFLDKILFAKNLSLMIKAGLPLRESVATIQEQIKNKRFKEILDDVIKNIDNGQSLAASLSRHPQVFDSLYVNMIWVGEESGTLEENLEHLALQLEKNYALRGKIQAATIYPSIILTAVIILSAALAFFILPKITPIFEVFDIELPLTTRILLKTTEIIQNYGLFVLAGLVILGVILFLLSRRQPIKFLIHKIILKLPIIGSVFRNVNFSYFSRTLGILLKSGMPVIKALEVTQTALKNLVFQKELKAVAREVQKGKTISAYLKKREAIFPLMVSRMIGVGEKTGKLEETLLYISDFYEGEVDKSIKNLSVILEPILLLIIGVAVGFIALSIISPIYEITRGLHI